MIRLFVIEDHTTIVVSSLRYLFRPRRDGILIAGFSQTVEEAVTSADPESFDLIILDLFIPGYRPLENIRKLREHFPQKPVAIYTSEKSTAWKKRMLDEGALTYITKDATREELKLAIQKSSKGEVFYFGQKEEMDDPRSEAEKIFTLKNITPVQYELVKLLSEGMTHKEISDRTGISRSMVEKILKNLKKTFNVRNNIELIRQLTSKEIL